MNQTGGEPSAPTSTSNPAPATTSTECQNITSSAPNTDKTGASNPAANVRAECLPDSQPASEWRVEEVNHERTPISLRAGYESFGFSLCDAPDLERLATLHNTQVAELKKEIASLRGWVLIHKSGRSNLSSACDTLRSDIAALTAERDELKARLEGKPQSDIQCPPNAPGSYGPDRGFTPFRIESEPTDHAREAAADWFGPNFATASPDSVKTLAFYIQSAIDKATAELNNELLITNIANDELKKERDQLKEELEKLKSPESDVVVDVWIAELVQPLGTDRWHIRSEIHKIVEHATAKLTADNDRLRKELEEIKKEKDGIEALLDKAQTTVTALETCVTEKDDIISRWESRYNSVKESFDRLHNAVKLDGNTGDELIKELDIKLSLLEREAVQKSEQHQKELDFYKRSLQRIAKEIGIESPLQLIASAENNEETYADILARLLREQLTALEKDSQRLSKLERYLSDPAKNISGPDCRNHSWEFGYNAGPAYCLDGGGKTLREAIDSLPDELMEGGKE